MRRGSGGFTLLEVMLATALAALLMVGVLAVVADLGRSAWADDAARADADHPSAAATGAMNPSGADLAWEACVRLVREDLENARRVNTDVMQQVALIGYGGLDAGDRAVTHRPVQVTYRLEQIDGQSWLIRRQVRLDVLTNQNVQRDLVWAGVRRWELTCLDASVSGRRPMAEGNGGGAPARSPAAPIETASPATDSTAGIAADGASDDVGSFHEIPQGDMPVMNSRAYWEYQQARGKLRRVAGGGASSATAGAEASTGAQPGDEAGEMVPAGDPMIGRSWRLRVWTSDSPSPTYERTMVIR